MEFTGKELTAIAHLVGALANADHEIADEEALIMADQFNIRTPNEAQIIMGKALQMSSDEACSIVSKMSIEEKRYVTAFLGSIICADGIIRESEKRAWALITRFGNLPQMSLKEAVEIMKKETANPELYRHA